jgi:hypothetical protein
MTSVQISEKSLEVVRNISERNGLEISDVLDKAVEAYRREVFLDDTNRAFETMRDDSGSWQEELEERALWEDTLSDGVNDE